jgi:hypothetical protein
MERRGVIHYRVMGLALVNTVMNSKSHKIWGISTSAENMLASQKDLAPWNSLVPFVTGPNLKF